MRIQNIDPYGVITIKFDQPLLAPLTIDELDYSMIFEFAAISVIDGSSRVDDITQKKEDDKEEKLNEGRKLWSVEEEREKIDEELRLY